MKNRVPTFFLLIPFLICKFSLCQNNPVDSLLSLVKIEKNDSVKLVLYKMICDACDVSDNLKYGNQGLALCQNIQSKAPVPVSRIYLLQKKVYFLKIIAVYYEGKNDNANRIHFLQKLFPIYAELKDTLKLEEAYCESIQPLLEERKMHQAFDSIFKRLQLYQQNNAINFIAFYESKLAWMYDRINYSKKSAEYFEKSLANFIKLNATKDIAATLSYLAMEYNYLNLAQKSLDANLKSLEYFRKEGDGRKIIRAVSGISISYQRLGNFKKALEYNDSCIAIANNLRDSSLLNWIYWERIYIYSNKKDFASAEDYGLKTFQISNNLKDERAIMGASIELGRVYVELKNSDKGLKYISLAYEIANKLQDIYALKNVYQIKFNLYRQARNFEKALENKLLFDELKDSINVVESHKDIEQKEILSEFQRTELNRLTEQKIKDRVSDEEKSRQRLILIAVSVGLILVIILLLFIYRNYHLKQKSNMELAAKNELIAAQKHLVEEKQKEIIDSIKYAQRIQKALITSEKYIFKQIDRLKKN